jgi:ribosome-associated heat shock protein Hsp15
VRVARTRTLAAKCVTDSVVRVNGTRITSAGHQLKVGDVVTLSLRGHVRVLEVVDLGERRSSAPQAALLFRDLTPPSQQS